MTVISHLLITLPLWIIGLVIFALVLGARALGSLAYRLHIKKRGRDGKSDVEPYIVSGVFALLAFMIGITFSIGVDRFYKRQEMVINEANAIQTVYLRTKLLDEPGRTRLQDLLYQYAKLRYARENITLSEAEEKLRQTDALQTSLWYQTVAALYPVRETDLASIISEAMNTMIDLGSTRRMVGLARIPASLLQTLLIITIVNAFILGFLITREDNRMTHASTVMFALFSLVILVLIDLDRPRSGTIMVSQRPIEELIMMMNKDMARTRQLPPEDKLRQAPQ